MNDSRRWLVAVAVLVLVLLYLLQAILMPFLVGALLAYLGDPLADRLEARGLGRTSAVCVVFLCLSTLLLTVLLISVPLMGRQLDLLAAKVPQWLQTIQHVVIPWLQQQLDLPAGSLPVADFKSSLTTHWRSAGSLLGSLWSHIASSSVALLAWLANLLLIPVVTFYLLRDWDVLVAHLSDMLPRKWAPTVDALSRECDEIIGAFIRGQLLVMAALALIYAIGLRLVGLDLALLLGLLAGLASIVPYLGFIVGIAAAGFAAYFQFQEWMPLLYVAAVFGVGQLLESMVLTPWLVGDRIGLHPVAVIFAIMAGGQLAGFTGVLLALPAAAVIMVWLRHIHRSYKQSPAYHGGLTE